MKSDASFYIQTFGCRCNQADSAVIRDNLCRSALEEAARPRDAGLVVVNTCTVTHRTDQQVRQAVRKIHKENPDAQVVVTGCYAERDPRALAALPGVRLVVGNADKDRLAGLLDTAGGGTAARIIRTPLESAEDFLLSAGHIGGRTRPLVKLQDGCDARCSYCIVPSVRGPARSARPENILSEIRTLVERGFQEIVLTGVHLGAYGRKMAKPLKLPELLCRILEIPGLGRLRLSSIEPMLFSRSIIELAAANPVIAPHFHIPLQSGSDRILRRMRRPYTSARVTELLEYIRTRLPAAGLGTDILIGFPGETEEDFEATCDIVRKSELTYAHVFPFSGREGTAAYRMPEQVPPAVIRGRARIVRAIAEGKNLSFRRRFLGQIIKGITLSQEEAMGESVVLTENYIQVRISGRSFAPNRLVDVRIDDVEPNATHGAVAE